MKKVLAIVAIAAFAACNNASTETPTVDSVKIKDSLAKVAAESAAKMDTAAKKMDTSAAKMDTAAKKMEKK